MPLQYKERNELHPSILLEFGIHAIEHERETEKQNGCVTYNSAEGARA